MMSFLPFLGALALNCLWQQLNLFFLCISIFFLTNKIRDKQENAEADFV